MQYRLHRRQLVPRPREEVFRFFEKPENLELMTPEFLNFEILTPSPVAMEEGATIAYKLSLHGIPMRWRSRIDAFEPNVRFVDRQLSGPYRKWIHLHEFLDHEDGTEIRDTVDYQLPFGIVGTWAHAAFVKRQLSQIFDHRRKVVVQHFGRVAAAPPAPP
jgi:hypothetical protein